MGWWILRWEGGGFPTPPLPFRPAWCWLLIDGTVVVLEAPRNWNPAAVGCSRRKLFSLRRYGELTLFTSQIKPRFPWTSESEANHCCLANNYALPWRLWLQSLKVGMRFCTPSHSFELQLAGIWNEARTKSCAKVELFSIIDGLVWDAKWSLSLLVHVQHWWTPLATELGDGQESKSSFRNLMVRP